MLSVNSNNKSQQLGKLGENFAVEQLLKSGLYIVQRNYKIGNGEIDIIALDGTEIAFIEVKTRKKGYMISGLDAVTKRKQKAIIRTAKRYLEKYTPDYYPRFDVFEIVVESEENFSVMSWTLWKAAFWEE